MGRSRHPKPTDAQNAGRTLRKAADVMEDRGWVQGFLGHPNQGFCAIGSIVYACGGAEVMRAGYSYMQTNKTAANACWHLNEYLNPGSEHPVLIEGWNDLIGRTAEEVIRTMRKLADELDPQL